MLTLWLPFSTGSTITCSSLRNLYPGWDGPISRSNHTRATDGLMPLNRVITIERPVITRDSFGSQIETWEILDQVWAEKRQTKGSSRFANNSNISVATRAATFRIRFNPAVNELMRVVDDQQRVWGIVGLAVVDFNRYHDLITQSSGLRQ